jgi:hypothetical protein
MSFPTEEEKFIAEMTLELNRGDGSGNYSLLGLLLQFQKEKNMERVVLHLLETRSFPLLLKIVESDFPEDLLDCLKQELENNFLKFCLQNVDKVESSNKNAHLVYSL